jgi:DNA polymerase elongation subunit (family B)
VKILFLDIENTPHLAYVWGLWKQNIPTGQIVEEGYTLSWSAKWYGQEDVYCSSLGMTTKRKMIKEIHSMLAEADVVVHYNGAKHDIPILNKEFVLLGLNPPAPYHQVDLLRTCRTQFKFASNKLEYVVEALGIGTKGDSGGFKTWIGCMNGNPASFETLQTYNIQDIIILEALYERLKPWIKGHANRSTYNEYRCCPVCGSEKLQRRGTYRTQALSYFRFQCKDCGKWSRGRQSIRTDRAETIVSV